MWNQLPNGGIEREIKRHLERVGYRKGTYELQQTELIAIERPGWKQIFEFLLVTTNDNGEKQYAKGIAFDDHRKGSRIRLPSSEAEFQSLLVEWGEGMIHRKISRHEFNPVGLLRFFTLVLAALFLSSVFWKFFVSG